MARKKTGFSPMVVTANELRSGRVVFRDAAGLWTDRVAGAAIAATPEEAGALLQAARADEAACRVVEPVLIDVDAGAAPPLPASLRERIRATGPTAGLPGDAKPFP
ncbi:MAG: DUF2849 domain-containing protein [Rhodospirillales bacterium]|jgi:hypothetical protein